MMLDSLSPRNMGKSMVRTIKAASSITQQRQSRQIRRRPRIRKVP